jgi:hypothetical protein
METSDYACDRAARNESLSSYMSIATYADGFLMNRCGEIRIPDLDMSMLGICGGRVREAGGFGDHHLKIIPLPRHIAVLVAYMA